MGLFVFDAKTFSAGDSGFHSSNEGRVEKRNVAQKGFMQRIMQQVCVNDLGISGRQYNGTNDP